MAQILFEYGGHTYEVLDGSYTWEEALLSASNRSYGGASGYLATVSSTGQSAPFQLSKTGNSYLRGYL